MVVANAFVALEGDDWDGFWSWSGGFFVGSGEVGVELLDLGSWGGGRKGMFVRMWRACLRAVSSNLSSSEFFEYRDEGEDGARE